MLKCIEFKGTSSKPNVDDAITEFFATCPDSVEVIDISYATCALPAKTQSGGMVYRQVSSCIIFYNEDDEEAGQEETYEEDYDEDYEEDYDEDYDEDYEEDDEEYE